VAVQFDGDMNDPTDQDLVRIEQKFLARYAGESRSNRPLFLPPGVQVKPLVIKPNEMMFGDTSREMRDNILAAFGVPVELIDLQGNTLHAESAFYNQTVNPLRHWSAPKRSICACNSVHLSSGTHTPVPLPGVLLVARRSATSAASARWVTAASCASSFSRSS
jgi:phage portal protein BeeE